MTPWVFLLPCAVVMLAGSWLSYSGHKAAWWFPWSLGALAALNGVLWALAARLSNTRTLYQLGAAWDGVTVLAYSILPLLAFGVRLTPLSGAGVVLVIAGACLVKWG